MPGLMEASDGRHYIVKMRGAGQGPLVLVTETICATVAAALGLPMPQIVIVDVPDRFGINEPDPEVRDLLRASVGANVAFALLAEATTFDAGAGDVLNEELASCIVWFDSFLLNVDRTARNPNLLLQRGRPFLIDHGAALYPQYTPETFLQKAQMPFEAVRNHVLLSSARNFANHAEKARNSLSGTVLEDAVAQVPEDLWPAEHEAGAAPVATLREQYRSFLMRRWEHANIFEEEVLRAQRAAETGL